MSQIDGSVDDVILILIPISMVTASVTSQMKLQTRVLVNVVSVASGVHILEFPKELQHVNVRYKIYINGG